METTMKKLCIILFALAFALNCYAADVKISDLTEVTSPTTATAVLPVVDAGATKKVTIDNILKRGSLTQAYDAELSALAGLTFDDKSIIQLTGASTASVLTCTAANQLIGVNAANDALECKSTINVTIDDSAAQFKHADSTAALKISVDGATADKTMTIQSTHTDNRTFTLPNKNLSLDGTFNDGKYCTYASSGTVISCNADGGGGTGDFKNEKLASFAWDNGASAVATTGSKRCVAIPYAATIVGYTMVISGDPGAGGTILNITKDAWSDSSLPTTEIDASAPPTVADDKVASTDSTLTGWTKSVAANDIICADVATNAVATWISLTIFGTK
jgi:hypothetical protein